MSQSTSAADTGSATPPHLLHLRVSHYNEKVRWALDLKRWPHTREALVPGFHMARVRALTGQSKVPVLILDGRAVADSTRILAELERLRPEPPLYPADPELRARALAVEDHFDEVVAPALRRLFWACYLDDATAAARMATAGASAAVRLAWRLAWPLMRPLFSRNMGLDAARVAAARARLDEHFATLEGWIGPSGYLVGDRFSVADLSAAAVMTAILRPALFPYPLPEPWPPALVALRAAVAERPGAAWVESIYRRHRPPSSELT